MLSISVEISTGITLWYKIKCKCIMLLTHTCTILTKWEPCIVLATNKQPGDISCDQRKGWRKRELIFGSQNGGEAPSLFKQPSQNPMFCHYPRYILSEHGEKCGGRAAQGIATRHNDRGWRRPVHTSAKSIHRPTSVRTQIRPGHGSSAK